METPFILFYLSRDIEITIWYWVATCFIHRQTPPLLVLSSVDGHRRTPTLTVEVGVNENTLSIWDMWR